MEELGLNYEEFEKSVKEKGNRYILDIEKDMEEGKREGVRISPSLFFVKTGDWSEIRVNYIRGSRTYENSKSRID